MQANNNLNTKALEIKNKLEKLVYLYVNERRLNRELVAERDELLLKLNQLKFQQEALQHQLMLTKASKTISKGEEQSKAMKLKINKLVKKIDQSISILNR